MLCVTGLLDPLHNVKNYSDKHVQYEAKPEPRKPQSWPLNPTVEHLKHVASTCGVSSSSVVQWMNINPWNVTPYDRNKEKNNIGIYMN